MALYQIILAYDGTLFKGSQRQAKSRTVQKELESALLKLGWSEKAVLMAGRTDAGVHAAGQVASFNLEWKHSIEELCNALNAYLPDDMAVRSGRIVDADFHPRFSAISRLYRYQIYCHPYRDPIKERFAWRIWPSLDVEDLISLAKLWLGKHDFSAFGAPPRPGSSTVRTVFRSEWRIQDDSLLYEVEADAFLYHMVRRLVYIHVAVAQKRISVDSVIMAIENQIELLPGLAPARGLSLVSVKYAS